MTSSNASSETRGPNCWQCRFFAVSWDPRMPYACQRLGFKTSVMPAIEVLRIDGLYCQGFEPKRGTTTPSSGGDTQVPSTPSSGNPTRLWQA